MMLSETTTVLIDPTAINRNITVGGGPKRPSIQLIGRSRAGDGTSFAIPELKWLFDCGALIQGWKPRVVFLTHTHSDHVHFLTHIKSEEQPPLILLPEESATFVRASMKAYQEMTDCRTEAESQDGGTYAVDYILRPTKVGEVIPLEHGNNKFVVHTLRMDHRIPCLGYSIYKIQTHLREEYVGLSGPEIGRLRKSGVEVTVNEEVPYMCFMGDTTAKVFGDYPDILKEHTVIVVECSFVDVDSKHRADTTKHTHWDDLQPYVASHPDTMFILTHFSLKYSALRLRNFFRDQQHIYNNIHPMLVESEVKRQWSNSNEIGDVPRCNCRICRL